MLCVALLASLSTKVATPSGGALKLYPPVYVGDGKYQAWTLTAVITNGSTQPLISSAIVATGAGIQISINGGFNWSFAGGAHGGSSAGAELTLATTAGPHGGQHPVHSFGTTEAKYQGMQTPFTDFFGASPIDFTVTAGNKLVTAARPNTNVTFTGMTRPMGCIQTRCCNCPFRTDSGNTVRLNDGSLVIIFNVFLQPEQGHPIKGDGSSVVAFKSDPDGLAWSFMSYVALAEDYQWSGEGPNESTLSLLADGKTLMAVIRLDAGDGHAAGKPYSKSFSSDDGQTWSKLVALPDGVGTAKPRMVLMDPKKGPLVLVGGRPGNKVWVNRDGMGGDEWVEQDLAGSSRESTTSYNGVVALSSTAGIITYDLDSKVYAVPFELL